VGTAAGQFIGPDCGGGGRAKSGRGSSVARACRGRRGKGKKAAAAGVLGFCRSSAAVAETLARRGGGEEQAGADAMARGGR
jgi:hypothetical protein